MEKGLEELVRRPGDRGNEGECQHSCALQRNFLDFLSLAPSRGREGNERKRGNGRGTMDRSETSEPLSVQN